MTGFCAQADLYCSREHLEQRIDTERTAGKLIGPSAAATLGRTSWMDVSHLGVSGP